MVFIKNNYNKRFTLEEAAEVADLNKFYLTKLFRKTTGLTIWQFLQNYRIEKAKVLLGQDNRNITDVCYEIGINDLTYFERLFKKHTGLLPSEFKKQQTNKSLK